MQASVGEAGMADEAERLTILVVEDEILIRMWISDCLRDGNLVVLEAASAEEAKIALTSAPGIDIVFSDVNMPALDDGIGLALWMAAHTPEIPVVLASARDCDAQSAAVNACRNVTDYIQKPYDCQSVQRLLRERVAGRKPKPAP